jgi:hypothetical protein
MKAPDSRLTILKHLLPPILEVVFEGSNFCFRNIFFTKSGPGWRSRISDLLRVGRCGDPILVEERFSAPLRTDPEAHPHSSTVGSGSFPELERPGRAVDHPPPSSAVVKERTELYFYSPSEPS